LKQAQKTKYSPEEFLKAYAELSGQMGYVFNCTPVFFKQDNGAFALKIAVTVIPTNLEKEEKKQ